MEKKRENKKEVNAKQEQIHDLLFNKEVSWQNILYDLINTEQLIPWDIDISLLANKYLEKIQKLEEQSFFISSKVLLAAALLLRIKSEILLNEYIKSIDDILFGRKEESNLRIQDKIELEGEIPELIPRSPVPRFRKVTLRELMESLNKAIITENRRIKREIIEKNAVREGALDITKRRFNIKSKIKEIYEKLLKHLENKDKIQFEKIVGKNREEKIMAFNILLHLENQNKVWVHQDEHFGDIHIWLKKTYFKHNDPFKDLRENNDSEQ